MLLVGTSLGNNDAPTPNPFIVEAVANTNESPTKPLSDNGCNEAKLASFTTDNWEHSVGRWMPTSMAQAFKEDVFIRFSRNQWEIEERDRLRLYIQGFGVDAYPHWEFHADTGREVWNVMATFDDTMLATFMPNCYRPNYVYVVMYAFGYPEHQRAKWEYTAPTVPWPKDSTDYTPFSIGVSVYLNFG